MRNIPLSVGYHAIIYVRHAHRPADKFLGQRDASVLHFLETLPGCSLLCDVSPMELEGEQSQVGQQLCLALY